MGIKDRVKKIINEKCSGSNEIFAHAADINVATLQKWDDSHRPNGDKLSNIHNNLGVNINWFLTGEGEPYIGKIEGKKGLPFLGEIPVEYQQSTSTLGKAVEMLAAVLNSGNQVFIQALMSNLIAFSEGVAAQKHQNNRISSLETEIGDLRNRLKTLENKSHEHPTAPSQPAKKQAM